MFILIWVLAFLGVVSARLCNERQVSIVKKTILAEAGGEGQQGMLAVASVIENRVRQKGLKPAEVCLQKKQFSCWNKGTPVVLTNKKVSAFAEKLAREICDGEFEPIGRWNHYCRTDAYPVWREKMLIKTVIGRHVFGVL